MSKLSEAMTRTLRREARSIGFAANNAQRTASMLVIARVAAAQAGAPRGADAVITPDTSALSDGAAALWGTEAPVRDREGARALRQAGADFIVFSDDTTDAAVLLEEDLGFVMRVALDATDTYLRTVEGLSLDALLVPGLEGSLTVRRTLDLRRIAGFARKALILAVHPEISPVDLEALRDCGVIGVVAEDAEAVAALRGKVDALPPRRRPKDARGSTVLLPAAVAIGRGEAPDDPDED